MTAIGPRLGTPHDTRRRVERRLRRVGINLPRAQVDQLVGYLVLLTTWNQRMNLTSLDDADEAVDRLIVEPVLAAAVIDESARSLMDIGSGGGSPAVPLKVVRPDLALTMVEVKTRKSVFLREVVRHLALQSVVVETVRFETLLSRPAVNGTIDVISIRAVRAEPAQLVLFAKRLILGGQQLWFLSGAQPAPAIPADTGLAMECELPLVASRRSRLLVLRRTA